MKWNMFKLILAFVLGELFGVFTITMMIAAKDSDEET